VWKRGDAFSSGIVEAIAQTPDGHFWLGSSTGLIRFDGAAKSHSMVRLRRSILGRTRAAPSRTLLATA
jgi:ligand-binding sensor domain-containing protein